MAKHNTNHYQEAVKLVGELRELEAIGHGLLEGKDVMTINAARKMAGRVIKNRYNLEREPSLEVPRDALAGHIADLIKKTGDEAREYLGAHLDEVVAGAPGDKLEVLVLEELPRLGMMPRENEKYSPRFNGASRKHREYLEAAAVLERYEQNDLNEFQKGTLMDTVADGREEIEMENLKEKGYDEKDPEEADILRLARCAARQSAWEIPGRETRAEAARRGVEIRKERFGEEFNADYSRADYTRELIGIYAEKHPREALEAIYLTSQDKAEAGPMELEMAA